MKKQVEEKWEVGIRRFVENYTTQSATHVEIICTNNNVENSLVEQAANMLGQNMIITDLELHGKSKKNQSSRLVQGLIKNTYLSSLTIWHEKMDDDLVKHLAKLLTTHPSLSSLSIRSCEDLITNRMAILADAIVHSRLKNLEFHASVFEKNAAQELAKILNPNSKLQKLTLNSCFFDDDAVEDTRFIANGLITCSHLTWLDLSDNNVGDQGVAILAEALCHHPSLRWLNLDNNELGHEGAEALATMLRVNNRLEELSLKTPGRGAAWSYDRDPEPYIGDIGGGALANALQENNTLTTLHLDEQDVGDYILKQITKQLARNQRLKTRAIHAACELLSMTRLLLNARDSANLFLFHLLPLELKTLVLQYAANHSFLSDSQTTAVIQYAGQLTTLGQDKEAFLEQTGCTHFQFFKKRPLIEWNNPIPPDSDEEEGPAPKRTKTS